MANEALIGKGWCIEHYPKQVYGCETCKEFYGNHLASPEVVERALRSQLRKQVGLGLIDDRLPTSSGGSVFIDIPELAKTALQAMGDAGNYTAHNQNAMEKVPEATSPASPSEISDVNKRRYMAAQIVEWAGKEVNGVTVGKVMEFLCEYPSPTKPVSVSLEKCALAAYNAGIRAKAKNIDVDTAKAVLESLKQQGVQFNVD